MRRAVVLVAVMAVGSVAAAGAAGYGPLAGMVADSPDASGITDGGTTPGGESRDSSADSDNSDGGASTDGSSSDDSDTNDSNSGSDAADAVTSDGRDPGPPFTIAIKSIETCGRTCRDVTLRVTNTRAVTATGVTVVARIYAGKRDDDGDRVWRGSAALGTLDPHESVTVTRRVKLGFVDAGKIKRNEGWMTIRTTVTGDDAEATFVNERDVA